MHRNSCLLKERPVFAIIFRSGSTLFLLLTAQLLLGCSQFTIPMDETIHPLNLSADHELTIRSAEAGFTDITPGAEKTIIWADSAQRTEYAIVYLHGFSATRQEVAPLCEIIADSLGANLYYTRLTGHGRPGSALAKATVNDWLNDTVEALEIGRMIGEKVIIISVSTGGTLATWLAGTDHGKDMQAMVLISPNFGPADKRSSLFYWPWAQVWGPWITGPTRSWEPVNEQNATYWTHEYPIEALFPMMGLVKLALQVDPASLSQPTLIINSEKDQVVDAARTAAFYEELGSPKKEHIHFTHSRDKSQHVIAGDILSPETTLEIAHLILGFINDKVTDRYQVSGEN